MFAVMAASTSLYRRGLPTPPNMQGQHGPVELVRVRSCRTVACPHYAGGSMESQEWHAMGGNCSALICAQGAAGGSDAS